jgi:hypothetical protein
MSAFSDLPPPRTETTVALLGLVVLFWFFARIQIIRRRRARGAAPDEMPRTPAWLIRLAAWPPVYVALGICALACAALLAWSLQG